MLKSLMESVKAHVIVLVVLLIYIIWVLSYLKRKDKKSTIEKKTLRTISYGMLILISIIFVLHIIYVYKYRTLPV